MHQQLSLQHLFGDGVLENQIQALSRTFRHRFKDFQGPCLFSRRTFQALKIWKKNSRTFKDPQEPCVRRCTLWPFQQSFLKPYHFTANNNGNTIRYFRQKLAPKSASFPMRLQKQNNCCDNCACL